MSVAASPVSAYSSESVVESSERVTLTGLPAVEPPLRSQVRRVMSQITTSVERVSELVGEASSVDRVWFQRGIEQANYAYFEASLMPVKRQLRQAIEAYLESPDAVRAGLPQQVLAQASRLSGGEVAEVGAVTWMMLADECLAQAFENRDQWQPGEDPLAWVAGFIPAAVAGFVGAA